jgi:hypothetical protein
MTKKTAAMFGLALLASIAVYAARTVAADKLPKCSKPLCRSVGCAADTLCYSGTTVKTCEEVCNGK